MNISKQTIETLNELGYTIHFQDEYLNIVSHSEASEMYIGFLKLTDNECQYIGKTIKATKKETTIDYIMDKITTDKVYKNFSSEFNKVVREFGLSAYPTSYGIGVSVIFISEVRESELRNKVKTALDKIGINYLTEYSEAGWVFRFKISKSSKNIELLKNYKA